MRGHRFFEGGELPSACLAGGSPVRLRTDFRLWLRYEHLLDSGIPDGEKAARCIEAVVDGLPPGPNGASGADVARAVSWFHSCGDSERLEKMDIPPNIIRVLAAVPRTSSAYWDFWQIWASFKKQHGLDLYACGEQHWWEFKRLLGVLKPDTPLAPLCRYRSMTSDDFKGHDGKMTAKSRKDWNLTKAEQVYRALPGGGEEGQEALQRR